MGRPFPLMQQKLGFLPAVASFTALAAILSVFSAVMFLCGAHHGVMSRVMGGEKTETVRLGGGRKKKGMEKMRSSLSSKALLVSKMVSWRKVDSCGDVHDGEEEDEDGVVWKKTIIKGDKCRPLDFSGKILYDNDGNLLPD